VDQRVSPFELYPSEWQLRKLFQTQGLQHDTLEALKVSRTFEPTRLTLIYFPGPTGSIHRHARFILPTNAFVD
jgi:hypothetical protein